VRHIQEVILPREFTEPDDEILEVDSDYGRETQESLAVKVWWDWFSIRRGHHETTTTIAVYRSLVFVIYLSYLRGYVIFQGL
jgi:hypothetical protein